MTDYVCLQCGEECAQEPNSFCSDCTGEQVEYGMHYAESANQQVYADVYLSEDLDDWV